MNVSRPFLECSRISLLLLSNKTNNLFLTCSLKSSHLLITLAFLSLYSSNSLFFPKRIIWPLWLLPPLSLWIVSVFFIISLLLKLFTPISNVIPKSFSIFILFSNLAYTLFTIVMLYVSPIMSSKKTTLLILSSFIK